MQCKATVDGEVTWEAKEFDKAFYQKNSATCMKGSNIQTSIKPSAKWTDKKKNNYSQVSFDPFAKALVEGGQLYRLLNEYEENNFLLPLDASALIPVEYEMRAFSVKLSVKEAGELTVYSPKISGNYNYHWYHDGFWSFTSSISKTKITKADEGNVDI